MPEVMHVESLTRKRVRLSDKMSMDKICSLLGVDSVSDVQDRQCELGPGFYEPSWTDEENQVYADEQINEVLTAYQDAVIGVAKELFDHHGLDLIPVPPRLVSHRMHWDPDRSWEWRVQPAPGRTWRDAVRHLVTTINGVGMFCFSSTKEFLDSGPYTDRQAVLSHLGWIPDWVEVYQGGKARGMVERRWRSR